jgi:hypothetical protein
MDVIKFSEYLLEAKAKVELPILDVVIDNDGNVYNGIGNNPGLIKGRVERVKGVVVAIKGTTDNKNYPAGIDKNGNLVAVNYDRENGQIKTYIDPKILNDVNLSDSEKQVKSIPMPPELLKKYRNKRYWDIFYRENGVIKNEDYYDLVPITPTGWVNVKVDMEIVKRVRRYSKGIATNNLGYDSFKGKLKEFQRISSLSLEKKRGAKKKRRTIQTEMSVIIMLHYINEIKDFFTPSSSGFLFESFLAGLIPNARVKEDNTSADIVAGNDKYQIKLISNETDYVDLVKDGVEYLDYYIICLKFSDKIDIYIVKKDNLVNVNPDDDILTVGLRRRREGEIEARENKPKLKLKNIKVNTPIYIDKYTIELSMIESRIAAIGKDLKSSLDSLYDEISKFQYNVETLITGTKADGSIVKEQSEFENYYQEGVKNIEKIRIELENLKNSIEKPVIGDPNQLSLF